MGGKQRKSLWYPLFLGGHTEPHQTAQKACVEDKAGDKGDSGRTRVFSPRTLGMQKGKPGL